MSGRDRGVDPALFGAQGLVEVSRGIAEFRARRPVLIGADGKSLVALPAEGLNAERLAALTSLAASKHPKLVVTARRALALGIKAEQPVALQLGTTYTAETILDLVAGTHSECRVTVAPAEPAANAAVELAKLAQVLPAILIAEPITAGLAHLTTPLIRVSAGAVAGFRSEVTQSLVISAEAAVPVSAGISTRFIVFRDALGESPVAIVVGAPDLTRPVPVRMHSACLTGDVFGSRRCDCGDQLKAALKQFAGEGGGIILYLPQEGRGVGLANKMHAYRLQDDGLDTVDANTTLGFDDDERDYGVAARMLRMLGCTSITLLTNNPSKLDGLVRAGIEIVARVPLETPINPDNRRYLTAKAARSGHQLDHLLVALSDASEGDRSREQLAT